MCSSKHTKIPLSKQFLECGIFQRFLNFTNAYWIKLLFLFVQFWHRLIGFPYKHRSVVFLQSIFLNVIHVIRHDIIQLSRFYIVQRLCDNTGNSDNHYLLALDTLGSKT
jgi:hypothetical protein